MPKFPCPTLNPSLCTAQGAEVYPWAHQGRRWNRRKERRPPRGSDRSAPPTRQRLSMREGGQGGWGGWSSVLLCFGVRLGAVRWVERILFQRVPVSGSWNRTKGAIPKQSSTLPEQTMEVEFMSGIRNWSSEIAAMPSTSTMHDAA